MSFHLNAPIFAIRYRFTPTVGYIKAIFFGVTYFCWVMFTSINCYVRQRIVRSFCWSDLRKLYFLTGVKNRETVFLFLDTQIVEESFLEDVNSILSSGEVSNLYKPDEFEEVTCTHWFPLLQLTVLLLIGIWRPKCWMIIEFDCVTTWQYLWCSPRGVAASP